MSFDLNQAAITSAKALLFFGARQVRILR